MAKDKIVNGDLDVKKQDDNQLQAAEAAHEDYKKLHEELKERLDETEAKLDETEAKAAEYLDTLKRMQAEMENYRKRMVKEQEQIIQYASQTVILELLPVIDNLERAIGIDRVENEGTKLLEGVELIYSQLQGILEREGVEVIDPTTGKLFDPQRHEAVMQVESDDHEENTIVEVMQKGYALKGRLLRPAAVTVAK